MKKPTYKNIITLEISSSTPRAVVRMLGRQRDYERSEISVAVTKNSIIVTISSDSLASIKAAANSILRDLQTLEGVLNSAKD